MRIHFLKRPISFLMVVTFLFVTIVGDNYAHSSQTRSQTYQTVRGKLIEVPSQFGFVDDSYEGSSGLFVFHIKDAHCNYQAQKSIYELIDWITKNYGVSVIGLEGASGEYDLHQLENIDDPALKMTLSEKYLAEGYLDAAEMYRVLNGPKVRLFGLEDPGLYENNLDCYLNTLPGREKVREFVDLARAELEKIGAGSFNEDQKKFYDMSSSFDRGLVRVDEYVTYLAGAAEKYRVKFDGEENIESMLDFLARGKAMDFEKANGERTALLEKLSSRLSWYGKKDLTSRTDLFKSGKISGEEYYAYLWDMAADAGISGEEFPATRSYNEYIASYSKIDQMKLYSEIKGLEKQLKEEMCGDGKTSGTVEYAAQLRFLDNLFSLKANRWSVENLAPEVDIDGMVEFLRMNGCPSAAAGRLFLGAYDVWAAFSNMMAFYSFSDDRDTIFAGRVSGKMFSEGEKAIIVITGGYHSENFLSLLRDKGISYVSINPSFAHDAKYPNPYLDMLSGEDNAFGPSEAMDIYSLFASSIKVKSLWTDLGISTDFMKTLLFRLRVEIDKKKTMEPDWIIIRAGKRKTALLKAMGYKVAPNVPLREDEIAQKPEWIIDLKDLMNITDDEVWNEVAKLFESLDKDEISKKPEPEKDVFRFIAKRKIALGYSITGDKQMAVILGRLGDVTEKPKMFFRRTKSGKIKARSAERVGVDDYEQWDYIFNVETGSLECNFSISRVISGYMLNPTAAHKFLSEETGEMVDDEKCYLCKNLRNIYGAGRFTTTRYKNALKDRIPAELHEGIMGKRDTDAYRELDGMISGVDDSDEVFAVLKPLDTTDRLRFLQAVLDDKFDRPDEFPDHMALEAASKKAALQIILLEALIKEQREKDRWCQERNRTIENEADKLKRGWEWEFSYSTDESGATRVSLDDLEDVMKHGIKLLINDRRNGCLPVGVESRNLKQDLAVFGPVVNEMRFDIRPEYGGKTLDIILTNEWPASKKQRELERVANYDHLTGIGNRRGFLRELLPIMKSLMPGVAFYMDIDHFKIFNETFGHDVGDVVLAAVADAARKVIEEALDGRVMSEDEKIRGEKGRIFRWGGEEFVGILRNMNRTEAVELMGKIQERIRSIDLAALCREKNMQAEEGKRLPGATDSINVTIGWVGVFTEKDEKKRQDDPEYAGFRTLKYEENIYGFIDGYADMALKAAKNNNCRGIIHEYGTPLPSRIPSDAATEAQMRRETQLLGDLKNILDDLQKTREGLEALQTKETEGTLRSGVLEQLIKEINDKKFGWAHDVIVELQACRKIDDVGAYDFAKPAAEVHRILQDAWWFFNYWRSEFEVKFRESIENGDREVLNVRNLLLDLTNITKKYISGDVSVADFEQPESGYSSGEGRFITELFGGALWLPQQRELGLEQDEYSLREYSEILGKAHDRPLDKVKEALAWAESKFEEESRNGFRIPWLGLKMFSLFAEGLIRSRNTDISKESREYMESWISRITLRTVPHPNERRFIVYPVYNKALYESELKRAQALERRLSQDDYGFRVTSLPYFPGDPKTIGAALKTAHRGLTEDPAARALIFADTGTLKLADVKRFFDAEFGQRAISISENGAAPTLSEEEDRSYVNFPIRCAFSMAVLDYFREDGLGKYHKARLKDMIKAMLGLVSCNPANMGIFEQNPDDLRNGKIIFGRAVPINWTEFMKVRLMENDFLRSL